MPSWLLLLLLPPLPLLLLPPPPLLLLGVVSSCLPAPSAAVSLQVNFLGAEHNPDLMLLAARALTFLADVFPPAAASIIRHGAVPAFCARLLTIEYIDLAEQSLQVGLLLAASPGVLCRCTAWLERPPAGRPLREATALANQHVAKRSVLC